MIRFRILPDYRIFKKIHVVPKDLDDIFDEYEGDFDLYIVKADCSGDDLLVDFILDVQDINDKGPILQEWRIIATGYRKDNISFGFASFVEIKDDHPLLWEFTETQCELYFNGQCSTFEKLFYDLYQTNREIFGNHQHFNIGLLTDTRNFKPFQYSNALLAKGAKKLMEKYAACLKKNELNFSIFGERPAAPENKDLKVLLMGDTYIIAKDFSFVKQTEGDQQPG